MTVHSHFTRVEITIEVLRLAWEEILSLIATLESSARFLEVTHGDWRKGRSGVMFGFVVMHFVDWDGGVDNMRLDGFYLLSVQCSW